MAFQLDAFSKEPNKGNPAGVVLGADQLTEEEMQEIALKVGFNETAFTLSSDKADVRIRYFTPGHEMDLCGHGTIATIFAMITNGLLQEKSNIMIETKAGILPLKIDARTKDEVYITMKQAPAEFREFRRHFSSAFSGTIEDPVTGTASGAMGAYYAKYIEPKEQIKLLIEQGQEMNKDGKVLVSVTKKDKIFEVKITGQAVFVQEFEVSI